MLRVKPPKRYGCRSCSNITSKPATVKLMGASFYMCEKCGGGIKERDVFIEWQKRKNGQWDVEKEMLQRLDRVEKTMDEVSKEMMHVSDKLFSRSFSELCYWGKLNILKEHKPIKYSKKST